MVDHFGPADVHGRVVPLRNGQALVVSPEGHLRGTPRAEREIVYVVQTSAGQETLTPAEFADRFGWTNDPGKVRVGGDGVDARQ